VVSVLVLAINGAIECLNREVPRSDPAQVQAQAPLSISNTPTDLLSTRLDNALTYNKTPLFSTLIRNSHPSILGGL
jgi:hypothetical protein